MPANQYNDFATIVGWPDRTVLDFEHLQTGREDLFDVANKLGGCGLILDFQNVESICSAALGVLITLHKKAEAAGSRLVMCNTGPQVDEILEITKLDRLFCIRRDVEDALCALPWRGPPPRRA